MAVTFFFPLCSFYLFKMTVYLYSQGRDCFIRKCLSSREAVHEASMATLALYTLTLHKNVDFRHEMSLKGCVLVDGMYLSSNGI